MNVKYVVKASVVPVMCKYMKEFILERNPLFYLFIFLNIFILLFLAALGLCCCAWAFSSCGKQGLLFVAVHGFLISVASLVAEHGL